MTLETLSRPSPVGEPKPITLGTTQFDSTERIGSTLKLPNGKEITLKKAPKEIMGQRELLSALIEAGTSGISPLEFYGKTSNNASRNLETRVKRLRKKLHLVGYNIRGNSDDVKGVVYTLKEKKPPLILPNGKTLSVAEGHLGSVNQYDVLKLLIERGEEGIYVTDFYSGNTNTTHRNLEAILLKIRSQLSSHEYSVSGKKNENGITNFKLKKIDNGNIVNLPTGEKIKIKANMRREVLGLLVERGEKGIAIEDVYGNDSKSETNLENLINDLRKDIKSSNFHIRGFRDKNDILRFALINNESLKVTLPNGDIVDPLPNKQNQILGLFAEVDLPISTELLIERFTEGASSNRKKNISTNIQRINQALGNRAQIKLATIKRLGNYNSAYYLELKNNPDKQYLEYADSYLHERIQMIQDLLNSHTKGHFKFIDKVNKKLIKELEEIQKELDLRKRIEERLKKGKEWYQNQARYEINNKDLQEIKEEIFPQIVTLTRIRYQYDKRGLSSEALDRAGLEALEKAKLRFDPKSGLSFEEYADFWIRGAMGNMLLYNSPEVPKVEPHGLALPDEAVKNFKEAFAIAIVDLSNRRRYPENFITPYESRALDIMRGITGKNSGSSEDVAYEFDSSIQWAERLVRTGMEKLMNSSHAPTLAKYLSS